MTEREQFERLQAFARAMFQLSDWPCNNDIGKFDFRQTAAECGLLIAETRTEPCGENCWCARYYGADGMADGVTCYRRADWL